MTNVYDLFTGKTLSQENIDDRAIQGADSGNRKHLNKSQQDQLMARILPETLDHSDQVRANQDFLELCRVRRARRVKKIKVCEFTWQTRNNRYVKANCYLDMETLEARSYQWWAFVKKIQGKVVFNNYRYSATTAKHQRQMRILLDHLNIKIDMVVTLPKGLQDFDKLKELKAFEVKKQA